MIWKIVLLLGVTVGVHGDEEAVSEQRVTIHHPKSAAVISQPEDKQKDHKDYAWSHPSYEFSYKVKDPHTHDIKGQTEERDGDKVKGDYWLIEPTGRKRTVKYHADDEIGFNAHVDYTKSEYSHKEKDQNNQVEGRRVNSQEEKQIQEQKNYNRYEVTEGYNKEEKKNEERNSKENGNNDGKGEINNSGDQRGNYQEEDILRNQEEESENYNNNENQEPISDAMVTLEALNENNGPQDNCKCNERRQNDYKINKNEVKNDNYGNKEMTSRRKRKNTNRSINIKRENPKNVELEKIEKNNNRKINHSDEKKNDQNNNLNDKKKKNDGANFGSRNGKRKQIQTQEKPQNNTVKIEEIKESENINRNDDDQKYQHRILIHHPKIVAGNKKN